MLKKIKELNVGDEFIVRDSGEVYVVGDTYRGICGVEKWNGTNHTTVECIQYVSNTFQNKKFFSKQRKVIVTGKSLNIF